MEDTRSRWQRAFLQAMDYDTWGQVEEAIEGWQRLQVASAAEYVENVLQLPMNRRDGIGKLAAALKCRIQELQTGTDQGVGINGIKAMKPFLSQLIITDAPFPDLGPRFKGLQVLDVLPLVEEPEPESESEAPTEEPPSPQVQVPVPQAPSTAEAAPSRSSSLPSGNSFRQTDKGALRGKPQTAGRGDTLLKVVIHKWGFKDAPVYQQPRVTMSVRDPHGNPLEAVQETPVSPSGTPQYVFFDCPVYVQTPVNRLPSGTAVFFEFKHWKAREKKKSCKAYSFLEMDEMKNGPIVLETYKKPPDFKRVKQPALLTSKPLYLHLHLTLEPCQ